MPEKRMEPPERRWATRISGPTPASQADGRWVGACGFDEFDTREKRRQSLVDALALQAGTITDISQVEVFGPKIFTTRGYGGYTVHSPSSLSARVRSGLSLLVPTEDTDRRENVVLLDYSGRAWYDGEQFRVGAGVGGRTNLNADEEESFEEQTLTFLGAAAQLQVGRVRPGLTLRVPLSDEPSEVLSYAAGLSVTVGL